MIDYSSNAAKIIVASIIELAGGGFQQRQIIFVGVLVERRKTGIFHAEGLEDVLFKKNVQRFSGRNRHHAAQNIQGDPAIPALPGLKFKGYLRQAVENFLKRPIVGFKNSPESRGGYVQGALNSTRRLAVWTSSPCVGLQKVGQTHCIWPILFLLVCL